MKGKFLVKGLAASGMVLQRNKINCIFGSADIYEDIIMTFRGVTSITQSGEDGNWKFEFSPGEAGGPFELEVKTEKESFKYNDVYVGEVWLSSGQSNAELKMETMKFSYPEEFSLPENPYIRMINIPPAWDFSGERDFIENPEWICASPQNVGNMSGTGYFFAKKLTEELGIPVGIINASKGGSPIASWLGKKALEEMGEDDCLKKLYELERVENIAAKQKAFAQEDLLWNKELEEASVKPDFESDVGWKDVNLPGTIDSFETAGLVWLKRVVVLSDEQFQLFENHKTWLWLPSILDADSTFVNDVQVGSTSNVFIPRRYQVPKGVLKPGKNIISIHVQKNSSQGKIRFYPGKPFCLFTDNVYVSPVENRNVECQSISLFPLDGECIDLSGQWQVKSDVKIRNRPEEPFFEWQPTALYNAMLSPCFKTAIAGVLWYQGESDANHPVEYKKLLVKLINLWRHKFVYASSTSALPFVIVQLPNWNDGLCEGSPSCIQGWPYLRQAQADAAKAAGNAGLVVTIDAGEWNDLHPEKKKTCGARAGLEALRIAYGKSYISPSPKLKNFWVGKSKITVEFDCGNSSLVTFKVSGFAANLNEESEDKTVYGFSLLFIKKGKMKLITVQGKLLSDNKVEIPIPRAQGYLLEVRYLWADSPAPVNLYSRDLLPAMPFMIKLEE